MVAEEQKIYEIDGKEVSIDKLIATYKKSKNQKKKRRKLLKKEKRNKS